MMQVDDYRWVPRRGGKERRIRVEETLCVKLTKILGVTGTSLTSRRLAMM